tara:strand:+ start:12851 stop:13156 length:306 start_codon:yes stop_codon:yes gene_type:complete
MLRKTNSIPDTDTIIKDPIMEPFFIVKSSSGGYTIYEDVVKGVNNTKYIKTICYPGNFNFALKRVAEELLHSDSQKKQYNLKEYIDRWNSIRNSFDEVFKY